MSIHDVEEILFEDDIREQLRDVKVEKARRPFEKIRETSNPQYFSALVHVVCGNAEFSAREKFDILNHAVRLFCELLTIDAVKDYLHECGDDPVLGKKLLTAFRKLKSREDLLSRDSKEVWITESTLQAVSRLSPKAVQLFAHLVLEKFEKLPGWMNSEEHHWGVMKQFRTLAGRVPQKPKEKIFLRLVKEPTEGESKRCLESENRFKELLNRPPTRSNQRAMKAFLKANPNFEVSGASKSAC